MKKIISVIEMLLLSVVIILSGCSNKPGSNEEGNSPVIYYISEESSNLVAEKADLPNTTKKGQLKFMINKLINPPEGKISPLCDGTTLNSVSIDGETAIVDFSDGFSNIDDLKYALSPAAVAKTLCSLDYINAVQILVDGESALAADGTPLGIIYESDLVVNKDEPSSLKKTTLVLYFSDEDAEFLVPERRTVEIAQGNTVEKAVIDELLKGPSKDDKFSTIPPESKLLSIETKDSVCFVNFSKEFVDKHSGGTTSERLTVYSIVNSLTELGTIDKVQFLIEGKKREEFIHMVFNEPIVRNKTIIKE